ncbi:hypothetical protein [Streptomyces cinereoruber]|uniref:hypothetical protein n=1 Tax=Streptomyces cinereoruber TaxID=67260 RepID=UPI003677322F
MLGVTGREVVILGTTGRGGVVLGVTGREAVALGGTTGREAVALGVAEGLELGGGTAPVPRLGSSSQAMPSSGPWSSSSLCGSVLSRSNTAWASSWKRKSEQLRSWACATPDKGATETTARAMPTTTLRLLIEASSALCALQAVTPR